MPSKDSNQKFVVLPTQLSDAEAVWACGDRAFGPGSFRDHIFPPRLAHLTTPEELKEWRCERLRRLLRAGDMLGFKCVPEDDETKVVGYAGWYRPGHFKNKTLAESSGLGPSQTKAKAESDLSAHGGKPPGVESQSGEEKGKEEKEDLPACMDVALHKECTEIMDRERKRIWGEDANYWYLGALAVDPEYQGLGLARKLVDMGLAWADADGVPTYLESTPEGAKIYPRFGFKTVGEYAFFGGEHLCEFQIRQPGASKTMYGEQEAKEGASSA